jgi:enoyl-CoA hydratase/carnithine racemase
MNDTRYNALGVAVAGGVATVTIDHPPINLMDVELFPEMLRLTAALADDDDVRVVVLRSANPDFFIAHFDVTLIQRIPTDSPPSLQPNSYQAMCETWRTMPKATIAVIEGRVGGGGSELALSCDMRFALAGKAVFNQPEVALGILPGGSGTVRLPRLIGRSRALEVILGCDDVSAELAAAWGWVNRALPADELWPFVNRLASRIAGFPSHAVRAAKASVLRGEANLHADLVEEANDFSATLGHPDTRVALQRFLDIGGQTVAGEQRLGELAGEL